MPLPLGWGAAMVGMGLVSYLWTRGSSTPSDLPRGTTHRQEPVVQKPTEPPRRVVNGTVHVFWDIENCQVPIGVHPSMVVQNIWRLRTSRGYSPSRIVAATSSAKLSTFLRNSLQSSGVELLDRPSSKPSAADMILLEEVQRFTLSHSDPSVAGVIFITTDMDFCPRLLSLKSCGYDVYLVHQEHISDTFRSMVEHRRLWQTVCGGTPTQFGTLQGSTVNVSGIQRKPYKPPVVPKPVPVSSDVPPQTGAFASGGRRSFVPTPLMDLFLVYNILCWIDRKCFHLVPKHTYPEKVFTALRQLQQVRMVYLSGPLTSNPVPTFIFILLLPKGEALLKLLRAVDSMSDSRPELKPFRALFYFWIRQAFGRGEGSCRISHLGTQIKPMITRGLLLDENGVLFGSVKDYCNRAAAMGVIEIERQSHLDGSITLKGSIAASWIAFKNISAQRGEGWGHTLQNVTGGEAAAIALINVLRGFTRLELLLLPVLCTQTSSFASTIQVVEGQLNQLAQIVGIVSQQLLQDASDAGLVYDGSISYRGLTTAGSLVVKSFLGALHVGAQ